MADATDDVEVEIEAPVVPPEGEIQVEKVEAAPLTTPPKIVEPEEGVEALRQQLEQEKQSRISAQDQARQASIQAASAQNNVQDTNIQLVDNAIATVKQGNAILKANYSAAMAAQDWDGAADIQGEMATNAARLLQLENGLQQLRTQPKAQPAPIIDPVESIASQLPTKSAAWIRRNPQFAVGRAYDRVVAAHNAVQADGIEVESPEYFAEVERILKITPSAPYRNGADEHDINPMADAAQTTQRRSSPPAAPVSRGGQGNGSAPTKVRLSAAEVEMAEMMGMTTDEYAKNKVALQKEGKLNA